MEKSRPLPSQQRLRELLAIPERKRTEDEWAEINELEIMLTPANRAMAPEQNVRRKESVTPPVQLKSRDGTSARQTLRKPRKKPPGGGAPGRGSRS